MGRTGLARQRTQMALDRTLMAWIRTSLSMTSFGFTIFKFFQYLREANTPVRMSEHLAAPRYYALGVVAIGMVSLIVAIVLHRRESLQVGTDLPSRRLSFPRSVALAVAMLGVVTITAVILDQ